jgi:hypothetical protein
LLIIPVLSVKTDFSGGTSCNIREDVPEEIDKLNADSFDYDSDSDLEDEEDCLQDPVLEVPQESATLSSPER